jgi:hypothetical protein
LQGPGVRGLAAPFPPSGPQLPSSFTGSTPPPPPPGPLPSRPPFPPGHWLIQPPRCLPRLHACAHPAGAAGCCSLRGLLLLRLLLLRLAALGGRRAVLALLPAPKPRGGALPRHLRLRRRLGWRLRLHSGRRLRLLLGGLLLQGLLQPLGARLWLQLLQLLLLLPLPRLQARGEALLLGLWRASALVVLLVGRWEPPALLLWLRLQRRGPGGRRVRGGSLSGSGLHPLVLLLLVLLLLLLLLLARRERRGQGVLLAPLGLPAVEQSSDGRVAGDASGGWQCPRLRVGSCRCRGQRPLQRLLLPQLKVRRQAPEEPIGCRPARRLRGRHGGGCWRLAARSWRPLRDARQAAEGGRHAAQHLRLLRCVRTDYHGGQGRGPRRGCSRDQVAGQGVQARACRRVRHSAAGQGATQEHCACNTEAVWVVVQGRARVQNVSKSHPMPTRSGRRNHAGWSGMRMVDHQAFARPGRAQFVNNLPPLPHPAGVPHPVCRKRHHRLQLLLAIQDCRRDARCRLWQCLPKLRSVVGGVKAGMTPGSRCRSCAAGCGAGAWALGAGGRQVRAGRAARTPTAAPQAGRQPRKGTAAHCARSSILRMVASGQHTRCWAGCGQCQGAWRQTAAPTLEWWPRDRHTPQLESTWITMASRCGSAGRGADSKGKPQNIHFMRQHRNASQSGGIASQQSQKADPSPELQAQSLTDGRAHVAHHLPLPCPGGAAHQQARHARLSS